MRSRLAFLDAPPPRLLRWGMGLLLGATALPILITACQDSLGPGGSTLAPPASLSAEALGPYSIRLTWPSTPAADLSVYRIERRVGLRGSFVPLGEIPEPAGSSSSVEFLDRNLEPSTFYGYRVRAVSYLGTASEPTLVEGARTAPPPGLRVRVLTRGPSAPLPTHFGIVLTGPESRTVSLEPNTELLISPLSVGTYKVDVEGVPAACTRDEPGSITVSLSDIGLNTERSLVFSVTCRDPNKGEILATVVTAGNQLQATPFTLELAGILSAGGEVTREVSLAAAFSPGSSTQFSNLEPGDYEVALTGVDGPACVVQGSSKVVGIQVAPLSRDTVRFEVLCLKGATENPDLFGRWVNAAGAPITTAAPSQTVKLQLCTSRNLNAFQGLVNYSPNLTLTASEDFRSDATSGVHPDCAGATDVLSSSYTPGSLSSPHDFLVISLASTPPASVTRVGIGQFTFTVNKTGIEAVSLSNITATTFSGSTPSFAQDIAVLTLQQGGGGGNVPPTARPGGPYTGQPGTPVSFNGSTSSDSDGSVVRYDWTWGDGTSGDNAGANPTHTYAAAGTYTVTLKVTDNGGATHQANTTAAIGGGGSGGGSGNFLLRWVNGSGSPITSTSAGSTVKAQICTTENLNTFQADITFSSNLTLTQSANFQSDAASGVHPDCAGSPDVLSSNFTPGALTSPHSLLVVSLAPSAPATVTRVGIAELTFTVNAVAPETLAIANVVATRFDASAPTVTWDIQTLGGSGGGGGQKTPPLARAGGPYAGTTTTAISFDGSASSDPDGGDIVRYVWSFGDGSPPDSSGAKPTHTYVAGGAFRVILTVRDDEGVTDADTTQAVITETPPSPFAWRNRWSADSVPVGQKVTLQLATAPAKSTKGAQAILNWDSLSLRYDSAKAGPFADFLFSATKANAGRLSVKSVARSAQDGSSVLYIGTVYFTARTDGADRALTVTDSVVLLNANNTPLEISGLPALEDTVVLKGGNKRPVAEANGPYVGYVNDPVSFTASGSRDDDGSIKSYSWSFGDGGTGSGPAPTHAYAAEGTFTVRLTVKDDKNAEASDSARVTITANRPPLAKANGPYAGVVGQVLGFSASGSRDSDGRIVDYLWRFGDGGLGTGPAPLHIFSRAGTFQVVLTVTDDKGGVDADTTTVTAAEPTYFALRSLWRGSLAAPAPAYDGPEAGPSYEGQAATAGPGDRVAMDISARPGLDFRDLAFELQWDPRVVRYDSIRGDTVWSAGFSVARPAQGQIEVAASRASAPLNLNDVVTVARAFFTVVGLEGDSTTTRTDDLVLLNGGTALGDTLPTLESTLRVREGGENAIPTAFAGGPYSGLVDQVITFRGSGSDSDGFITSYAWNFGDGTSGTGAEATHVYTVPGTYAVALTVTDNNGASGTDITSVAIVGAGGNQLPIARAGGPYTATVGFSLQVDGGSSIDPDGSITEYRWQWGDGGVTTGSNRTPSHTYGTAGTFDLVLRVKDGLGAFGYDTTAVTVSGQGGNQVPTAQFTLSCAALSCSFNASASSDPDGTITNYQWEFGDSATASGITTSHTYAAAGTYTVTLTVRDNQGATATRTNSFALFGGGGGNPVASFTSSCTQLACTFDGSGSTDPGGSIASYAWNFGDGSNGTGVTPSHTYGAAGTYNVTLTVTDNSGNTGQVTQALTVSTGGAGLPTGNFLVRWVDASGNPITTATIGQTVKAQICTTENLNAFQADVTYTNTRLTLTASADLNSAGTGVHPDCAGTADVLNQFVPGALTSPHALLSYTLGADPGTVTKVGIAQLTFTLQAAGVETLSFSGVIPQTFAVTTPTVSWGIQPLTVTN